MKFILNLFLTISCMFIFSFSTYAESKTPIVRDGSNDGGARIMRVFCPSGKNTTLRLFSKASSRPSQTCVYKPGGSEICKAKWDMDEAALEACKN